VGNGGASVHLLLQELIFRGIELGILSAMSQLFPINEALLPMFSDEIQRLSDTPTVTRLVSGELGLDTSGFSLIPLIMNRPHLTSTRGFWRTSWFLEENSRH
jgi:hypothetical protein